MFKALTLFSIVSLILWSCVPIKEIKYLQKTEDLKTDSLGFILENETAYHVQVDDILAMTVTTRDPEISKLFGVENTNLFRGAGESLFYLSGLSIDDLGYIEVPSLGKFYVLGKTVEEITLQLKEKMFEIYKDNVVFIRIKLSGINYTILGEVRRPGQYVVYRNRLDLLEAIARSGDLSIVADRKKIRLLRKYPEGRKIVEIDLTKDVVMNSEFFYLKPNDIILINPKVQKTIGTGTSLVGSIGALAGTLGALVAIYSIIDRFSQ